MAEIVGLSHAPARRGGVLSMLRALVRKVRRRSRAGRRIHALGWSDYMLRDIGLPPEAGDDRISPFERFIR